jgi:hypothetical protein
MRKAEGYGLPFELIDKNPVRAMLRYGRRAGNDLSYFKNIQSDPEMLKALGLRDQFGENPSGKDLEKIDYIGSEKEVQDAMKHIWGKNVSSNPRFSAAMRLAGNLVMGHGTSIRNILSIPTNAAVYDIRIRDYFKVLGNLASTRERAYETGAARINTSEFEYLGDMGNPDPWVKNMDKMSQILRKYQGRNLSDKFEGEFFYSLGEEWAKNMLATKNEAMLKRATGEADYKIPSKPSQEDISKIASGFTRLTRGSYSPTGLPNWALTGNIAPFAALNRFGIEKWNNVAKDIVQPLKNGNITPFLRYTLTAVGFTGPLIEQVNELLSGRKGSDLSIKEAMAAYAQKEDPQIISEKIFSLMQLSSYAGIMGDFMKMASRASSGKELSYSNPIGMPLYSLATDTLGENLGAAIGAIKDGEDPINVLAEFVKTVPLQTLQIGRYLQGNLSEEGKRKEEFADYRKYKEATGESTREELRSSKGNPYSNIDEKEFKRTEDINKAVSLLPTLIQNALKKAGNDPYKLKSEFEKIKSNSFQIMPSIENEPLEFFKYMQYLKDSQGEKVASDRLTTFFKQRALNQVKSSMVP